VPPNDGRRGEPPTNRQAAKSAGFNLSKWALDHAPLTRYLMVVLMVLGTFAYFQLGQDEDPPFTFRAMVVRTYWPGATAQQVAEQVTDKLERTLQEAPYADKIRSYSKPGESQIIFQIKDSSKAADVANVWYTVRKKIGDMRNTLPPGVQGPFFNDDFGDVYGVIYALESEGFSYAELKTLADETRQQLLRVKDVAKVDQFGVQDEKVYVEISQKRLAQLGLDFNAVLAQLGSQNAVESAGTIQSPLDVVQVRVAGQFTSVDQLRDMPIRGTSGNQLKLGDIAEIHRGYIDPPAVKVHHQGKEVIALGVSMAKGGDIIALGKALKVATAQIDQRLPIGVKLAQVQDQPVSVASSVNEFVGVLIEAVAIVLAVSIIALGLHKGGRFGWYIDMRPGLVVAITIPLVLAVTFLAMNYFGIGLHKISLGSLIIALGSAGGRRDHRGRDDGAEDGRGLRQGARRHLRVRRDGQADAHGHADHSGRFLADRPREVGDGRIHLRDLRGDGDRAGAVVDRLGVLRAVPGHAAAQGEAARPRCAAARALRHAVLQRLSPRCGLVRAAPVADHRRDGAGVRARHLRHGQGAAAVLPDSSRPEIMVDIWFPEAPRSRPTKRSPGASSSA
jgi:hypothetical protein